MAFEQSFSYLCVIINQLQINILNYDKTLLSNQYIDTSHCFYWM